MKMCSFRGCERPLYARDLCHTHYAQDRSGRALKPISARRSTGSVLQRDEQGRKQCLRCGLHLPESSFQRDPSHADLLSSYCRACRSAHARAWRYGVTPERIEQLIADQGGECVTCRASLADGFCVDHDHSCCAAVKTCGKCIRGLLCPECNKLIGKFEADRARLARILDYIKEG